VDASPLLTTWLPALLIGAVLGYGAIFLRELGWLFALIGCGFAALAGSRRAIRVAEQR
jgi:hypothetical protein